MIMSLIVSNCQHCDEQQFQALSCAYTIYTIFLVVKFDLFIRHCYRIVLYCIVLYCIMRPYIEGRLDRYRIGIPHEFSEIRTQPWLSEGSLTAIHLAQGTYLLIALRCNSITSVLVTVS